MDKIKRILALLLVAFLIFLIILMVYFGLTGSRYFLASVYAAFGFPLLVYAFIFIYRMFRNQ